MGSELASGIGIPPPCNQLKFIIFSPNLSSFSRIWILQYLFRCLFEERGVFFFVVVVIRAQKGMGADAGLFILCPGFFDQEKFAPQETHDWG
jgi:hypothetical protein